MIVHPHLTQCGPGHIVLDGDPTPPPKRGTAPQFLAHICCGQMAGWIKIPLSTKVGLDPCLLWPNDWMDQDGTWHGRGPWLVS